MLADFGEHFGLLQTLLSVCLYSLDERGTPYRTLMSNFGSIGCVNY